MHETERLSALIGDIYDAALDPTLWVGVLAKSAAFVGGPAASLYSRDVAKRTMGAAYQYGLDPRYVQLAEQKYIKLDPTALGYFIADIEQPVSTADVMPYDEFLASRFYQEWAKPQGLGIRSMRCSTKPSPVPPRLWFFATSATALLTTRLVAECGSSCRTFAVRY